MPNLPEPLPPPVSWVQRKNYIFLTICLEDCQKPTVKLEKDSLFFDGVGGTERKRHQVTIQFYSEIDDEKSRIFVRPRNIEVLLRKKEDDISYWPHLTKQRQKYHWLKLDFTKWKDESDSEIEEENFENIMREWGGLIETPQKPNFNCLEERPDSDDDDMPELE